MASQSLPGHARQLTFGVEFEFLVARRPADLVPHSKDTRWTVPSGMLGNSNKNSANTQAQDFIKSLLANNGVPALSKHRYGLSDIAYVRSEIDSQGVQPPPEPNRVAVHAFWMVSDDPSIQMIEGEDIDGYQYEDVEVASRILQESNFHEVEKVYSLIQNAIKTQVNSSCGLHYHVGIKHLSLESVKKLVTLLMVVEDTGLFQRICAQHRSSPANHYCQPVSKLSRAVMRRDSPSSGLVNYSLATHLPQQHGISRDLLPALACIWHCVSVDEIAKQTRTCNDGASAASGFNGRGGFAVRKSIVELSIEGDLVGTDPTVEFRYKESTGSAREDYHWLQLCLSLARGAEWPRDRFRAALGVLSTANSLEGLLNGLGVGENEVRWWSEIARRHRDHPAPSKKTEFLKPENVSSSGVV
ncbi:hypothetical protein INS49_000276 [Diaporthe citri]|uniref:uncharacterized protein n=1 Tax=Diaporthe citri TaxID=83186 RepID=UPI001C7EC162|nr:uncharacterized protein INS49_000276 [Diaporthe citri]KAG6366100.1 hypothetical protein INS49_000276 [Diaporthe citri]